MKFGEARIRRLFQNRSRAIFVVSILWLLYLYNGHKHPLNSRYHAITSTSIDLEHAHLGQSGQDGFLPTPIAKRMCLAHNWKPYTKRGEGGRKVYDLFMINDELDWLEIRLRTLFTTVDYFVVLESPVTFTGLEKPLHLKNNWDRFAQWHSKIIYHTLENAPLATATRAWDLEDFQRNAMFLQTFPAMEGERMARIGDVILVSDVDEVPRPATVMLLRECDTERRVTIRSQFYYYGFEFLHVGPEWPHPQATTYQGLENTILPANLRNGDGGNILRVWWEKTDLWNGGWHCSTCFETVEEVLVKLSSFSHMLLNTDAFRDRDRIVDRVSKGLDLWDRKGENYKKVDRNEDVPGCLKADKERWSYLLDRARVNGGFKDYTTTEDAG